MSPAAAITGSAATAVLGAVSASARIASATHEASAGRGLLIARPTGGVWSVPSRSPPLSIPDHPVATHQRQRERHNDGQSNSAASRPLPSIAHVATLVPIWGRVNPVILRGDLSGFATAATGLRRCALEIMPGYPSLDLLKFAVHVLRLRLQVVLEEHQLERRSPPGSNATVWWPQRATRSVRRLMGRGGFEPPPGGL